MSRQTEDNLQRLISLVGKRDRQNMVVAIGTVQNIDEDNRLCEIRVNDDLTLFNCRLNAVLSDYQDRLLIVPKDKSAVAFLTVDGNLTDPIIIAYSEIDKVLLKTGDTEINISDEKIEINGGENNGIVKIQELTDKLNDLVNWCKNHTHSGVIVGVSGGVTTPAVGTSGSSGAPTSSPADFDKSDYEDEKVTH